MSFLMVTDRLLRRWTPIELGKGGRRHQKLPYNYSFFRWIGAGSAGNKNLNGGDAPMGAVTATSELVTADNATILGVGAPAGANTSYQNNAGPQIENLGFRDVSASCASTGGIQLYGMAGSVLRNLTFTAFCNASNMSGNM